MWSDLIAKSKEGGADVIQTYVFWSGHEPVKGQVSQISSVSCLDLVKTGGFDVSFLWIFSV